MLCGALIVAAGKPQGTDPLDTIGSITVAQRIISVLRQAEIMRIAVVTGYNAFNLEKHLASNNIVFLRNNQYDKTQMFDSIKLGIEYMKDKVDALVISPMDVPLFTSSTVRKEMASEKSVVIPVCGGRRGHPVFIRAEAFDSILCYQGTDGLRGALKCIESETEYLPVDDRGVNVSQLGAETASLLDEHNESLLRPVLQISVAKEKCFLDEQMSMLLMLISETGSVREACERMQISYSSAWNRIKTLESQLSHPLIERVQGGAKNGRSRLTDYGRKLLYSFGEYAARMREYSLEIFDDFFSDI